MDQFQQRDVFNRAADLLEQQGWVSGAMCDADSHCMVGALRVVVYGTPYPEFTDDDDWSEAEEGGPEERYAGIPADTLIDWNDNVAGDAATVIERLRQMGAGMWNSWEDWQE